MKSNKQKILLVIGVLIAIFSSIATGFGILSDFGRGSYQYESIRGQPVEIYGIGIYSHMSSDVAIQGIAQDYITLFIAIPLLIISLFGLSKARPLAQFLLAGTIGYFFVTYLFYTAMGMYNVMFLIYVSLLCLSFFGLYLSIRDIFQIKRFDFSAYRVPYKFVGWFLIVNSVLIALLWLSIIIPPLIDGTIYPIELEHYTTLIVQGFDLGLLLPTCFVSGILLLKKTLGGLIYGSIYVIFLAILLTALTAKIIAMGLNDVNIIPVVFIIPTINLITVYTAAHLLNRLKNLNKITIEH